MSQYTVPRSAATPARRTGSRRPTRSSPTRSPPPIIGSHSSSDTCRGPGAARPTRPSTSRSRRSCTTRCCWCERSAAGRRGVRRIRPAAGEGARASRLLHAQAAQGRSGCGRLRDRDRGHRRCGRRGRGGGAAATRSEAASEAAGSALLADAVVASSVDAALEAMPALRPLLAFVLPHLIQAEWAAGAMAVYDEATDRPIRWHALAETGALAFVASGAAVKGKALVGDAGAAACRRRHGLGGRRGGGRRADRAPVRRGRRRRVVRPRRWRHARP